MNGSFLLLLLVNCVGERGCVLRCSNSSLVRYFSYDNRALSAGIPKIRLSLTKLHRHCGLQGKIRLMKLFENEKAISKELISQLDGALQQFLMI